MGEETRDDRGFRVVDRRSGRETPEDEAPSSPPPGAKSELPEVDFAGFCLSLGTSVLYHLGVVGDPETGETVSQPNLPLARQTIDALVMLREKTRGNLDSEESKLLESLLYELQMRFVEAGPGGAGAAGAAPSDDRPRDGD